MGLSSKHDSQVSHFPHSEGGNGSQDPGRSGPCPKRSGVRGIIYSVLEQGAFTLLGSLYSSRFSGLALPIKLIKDMLIIEGKCSFNYVCLHKEGLSKKKCSFMRHSDIGGLINRLRPAR